MTTHRVSGDGWVECGRGHRHWGRFGAAGLLVAHRRSDGTCRVLLQHRAPWVHLGGTWSVPGGAVQLGETATEAAFREALEESGHDLAHRVAVHATNVDDHGGWSYTTVVGAVLEPFEVGPQAFPTPWTARGEQQDLAWITTGDVEALPLHPGFAASWSTLRALLGRSL